MIVNSTKYVERKQPPAVQSKHEISTKYLQFYVYWSTYCKFSVNNLIPHRNDVIVTDSNIAISTT